MKFDIKVYDDMMAISQYHSRNQNIINLILVEERNTPNGAEYNFLCR